MTQDKQSRDIDNMSCVVDIGCPVNSRSCRCPFHCTLPGLRDDGASNLRRWAELHCAQSVVFRGADGLVRGRRGKAPHDREFRAQRPHLSMAIDVPLHGRWLTPTSLQGGPRRGDRWQVSKWSDRCPSSNSAQRLRAHPARRCMRQRTTRTSELSRSADNRTHQFQRGLMNMLGRHAEMSGARDKPSRKWVNRCTGAIDAQAQPVYRAYRPWRGRALLRQPLHRHQRRKNRVLCECSPPLWAHCVNISSRRCGNFCTHA